MAEVPLVRSSPPPVGPSGRRPWGSWLQDNLRELMKTPDEWGLVAVYGSRDVARRRASQMRRGSSAVPPGRWEFIHGPKEDNPDEFGIWARYLGPEEESP